MQLSDEARKFQVRAFISSKIPCVIFSTMTRPSQDMIDLAYKYNVPTFCDRENYVQSYGRDHPLAGRPAGSLYFHSRCACGCLWRGVLITGESGIGKSEAALELIKRSHRLVSDDVVRAS